MIKNVEFKTPNNEVFQEANLVRLYDNMSEKIVKESEDFEGLSSFIEVLKNIAKTKAIINVINKMTLSVSCGLFSQPSTPTPATPRKRQVISPPPK
ncbi:hypothetical protein TNCV_1986721 [Trichonephila clavipes]|nr:hypothetical protein TNCV_1986721 [Trichonephila clavipes]